MTATVEVHVLKPQPGQGLWVSVHPCGVGEAGMHVSLVDLTDLLIALAEQPRGLRTVDGPLPALHPMDDSVLRLVIELTREEGGPTNVTLRRMDRSVDYGPLSVHDLPHVIEALVPEVPAQHTS